MKIWEPKPPGTLWATPGLLRDSFNLYLHVGILGMGYKVGLIFCIRLRMIYRDNSTKTASCRTYHHSKFFIHFHVNLLKNSLGLLSYTLLSVTYTN